MITADLSADNTMQGGFARWSPNTAIGTVIDVGASSGVWSRSAMQFWPDAKYFLIEARSNPHEPSLRRFEADCLNMQYVIAAASDKPGMVHFHDSPDPYGGVASHNPFSEHGIQVPATTIDAEVEKHLLEGPFL